MYNKKEAIYGTSSKIGLIYIASSWIMEPEFYLMSPPGVITCTTRISLGDSVTEESLLNLGDQACDAAELLAESPLDVIALGCTSGSFIGGNSYDLELIKKMEQKSSTRCTTTGRPVIFSSSAIRGAVFKPVHDINIPLLSESPLRERTSFFTVSRVTMSMS